MRRLSRDDSGSVRAESVGPDMARGLPALRRVPSYAVREMLREKQPALLHG